MNIAVLKESINRCMRDFSFLTVMLILFILNLTIYFRENGDYFYTFGIDRFDLWMTFMFDTLIIMAYSSYLASKIIVKELEKNTFSLLLLTPMGNKVRIQKEMGGIIIIFTITLIMFLQPIITMLYFGAIPLLFVYWDLIYSIIAFISGIFMFYLSKIVGILTKKSLYGMLTSAIYLIVSFFTLAIIPGTWSNDTGGIMWCAILPFMANRYAFLATEATVIVPLITIIVPIAGLIWVILVDNIVWRWVRL